jgi:hypothetical protein
MAESDYSLPQSCPAELEPHLAITCGDAEHAILAMSEAQYAEHFIALYVVPEKL